MICIICYLIYNRIQGPYLAYTAIVICLVFIILSWVPQYYSKFILKKQFLKPNSNDCITQGVKKNNGIFANGCIDIWHIFHLIFWIIIGLLAPQKYILVLIISVIWELFEHFYFNAIKTCSDSFCGRVEDVFLNILGYIIGSLIVVRYY